MDIKNIGRKQHESISCEDGNSSNDWSDGEFDDETDDIYDFPEQDESNLAERDDAGDGYGECDDLYDTPEDARQLLEKESNVDTEQGPPAVSRSDKPGIKELQKSFESNPTIMHKQVRHDPGSLIDSGPFVSGRDSDQSNGAFETYDAPKRPVRDVGLEAQKGVPKPTPRPKPAVTTKPDTFVSNCINNNQPSVQRNAGNSLAGRWPPRPQIEETTDALETYDVPPPSPTSKHQNIINKLSRVINTNTPNIPVREPKETPTSQVSLKRPVRHDQTFPTPDNTERRPSNSMSPTNRISADNSGQISRNGYDEMPNDANVENYEVPSRSYPNNVQDRDTVTKPMSRPINSRNQSVFDNKNGPAFIQNGSDPTCIDGQENYEVPQPEPQLPPGRPSFQGRNQNRPVPAPCRPEKPSRSEVKRFAEPAKVNGQNERRTVQPPTTEEKHEFPSGTAAAGEENYEVPRAEETRSQRDTTKTVRPSRNAIVGSVSASVPDRPEGRPSRGTVKNQINNSNPPFVERKTSEMARMSRGSLWGTQKKAPEKPVEPENYEVPAVTGQEQYEVPSQEPEKPKRDHVRSAEGRRHSMPLQSPANLPEMLPPRDKRDVPSPLINNRPSIAMKGRRELPPPSGQIENYEVPSSNAVNHPVGRRHDAPLRPPKENESAGLAGKGSESETYEVADAPPIASSNRHFEQHGRPRVPNPPANAPRVTLGSEITVEETYEVADAPPIASSNRHFEQHGKRRAPNPPANAPQVTSGSEITVEETYEVVDGPPGAVSQRNERPNTLGVSSGDVSRNNQNIRNPSPLAASPKPVVNEPAEQETYEVVDQAEQSTELKTAAPTASFGAVMQELSRKSSLKGSSLPSLPDRGDRCPPEGQEKQKTKQQQQSPMDQMLNNVISGLERPITNTALPKSQRLTPKAEASSPSHSRSSSLRVVPPRPGSLQEHSPDGPLLDISELNVPDRSPSDTSPRTPGRKVCPLPAVPQERTEEEILRDQPWFKGNMERKEAEELLKRKGKNGGFIVRNTTKIDGYSISIYYQGSIRHLHIPRKNKKYHLGTSEQWFNSVVELVNFYMNNAIELKAGGTTKLFSVM